MAINWQNAFRITKPQKPSGEELALIDKAALAIRARGLSYPAVLAIESTRPLHGIGAQAVRFALPALNLINPEDSKRLIEILENPGAVDLLISKLEADKHSATTEAKNGKQERRS